MAILIEDPDVVQRIEQLAARLHVSPIEVVESAVKEKAIRAVQVETVDEETRTRRRVAIKEAQEWFRLHGNQDSRTPDELIGYDENGLPT